MEFVDYFLKHTDHPMWVSSIDNAKGKGAVEKPRTGRDAKALSAYATKMDLKGCSIYYCVATIEEGKRRKKQHAKEIFFLWTDLDFREIDLDPAEILDRIKALKCPPTRIHATGGGYHCLWELRQRVDLTVDGAIDQVESVLKLLALNLAGDPMVCQVVSLLRMPETHNPKREQKPLVDVVRSGAETYSLRELTDWLGSLSAPVMLRRGENDNPYLRFSASQNFKAPVDVEDRLASMVLHGVGDSAVHSTQLSVVASLAAQGWSEDEITEKVLEATQGVEGSSNWDWRREERKIRELYRSFMRKHGDEVTERVERERSSPRLVSTNDPPTQGRRRRRSTSGNGDDEETEEGMSEVAIGVDGNVVRLEDARPAAKVKAKDAHVVLGGAILFDMKTRGERLLFCQGRMYVYSGGVWRGYSQDDEKIWSARAVEKACRGIKLTSTTKLVAETRAWLQRNPDIHDDDVKWDAHGMIATKSGLIDPRTWEIRDYSPDDYATLQIDCKYEPRAKCPAWKRMLSDALEGDAMTIQFVQECMGASLLASKPRTLMRALILLGESNSGKSNLLNVMGGLVSKEANTTPLSTLENAHGLTNFLSPKPWVLHEAFDQARWEMSSTAKALLSGDPVTVNIKNGALVSHHWKAPVFWGTNVPPQFKETSRAMENRLAIVHIKKVYDASQVVGVALEAREKGYSSPSEYVLAEEKEGVLVWALEGLKRALARGHFAMTSEMAESLHQMRTASNIAAGFVEECCEYDADKMVSTPDFFAAFSAWWRETKGGNVPAVDSLGKAMSALSSTKIVLGLRSGHLRQYVGIKLTETGLDFWNANAQSIFSERSGARIAASVQEVNKDIPAALLEEDAVVRLRRSNP